MLGRAPKSPGLSGMALCSWCPVGPSGTVFPVNLSQALKVCSLCELHVPLCCSLDLVFICTSMREIDPLG